jgi:hypothetical protein
MDPPEPFGINSRRPGIAPRDTEILRALIVKYQRYVSEGRGREAHGAASALLIVWQAVASPEPTVDVDITAPQPFDALIEEIKRGSA